MKRVFVVQPVYGRSDEEILAEREYVRLTAEGILKEEVEIIDSFFQWDDRKPLECLGESLKLLAGADWVWFCEGWDRYRGCKVEHICAYEYGVPILNE